MFPRQTRITWSANPTDQGVTAYRVTVNGTDIGIVNALQINYSVPGPGTYTVEVRAINSWGEGPPGSAVLIAGVPTAVTNVTFVVL